MQHSLDHAIQKITRDVRRADFLWAAGLSGGACLIFAIMAGAPASGLLLFLVIAIGLVIRYQMTKIKWPAPIRSAIEDQLEIFARFQAVLNALPEPVILLKMNGTIDALNPATKDLAGDIKIGSHLTSVLRAPPLREAIEHVSTTGERQIAEFKFHGASEHDCRAYCIPLKSKFNQQDTEDNSQNRLLVFISDLSQERRLNKMRTDFIANASHELRTPLTSMIGFIETLRGHAKDDPEATEKFLGIMEAQAQRMQRLVQDLMSLSTIEMNENIQPNEKICLVSIADDVKAALRPVIEKYNGTLEVDNQLENNLLIPGDRDELFQVIQNLSENALKYSDMSTACIVIGRGKASFVEEAVIRSGDTPEQIAARAGLRIDDLVYVQLRDYGQGIDRTHLPRLTERFYRADTEKNHSRGGTGLGLAIVKHIVNRHKGGLQIESSAGKGSAFTVYLLPK